MTWNTAAEWVSGILLTIMIVYSHRSVSFQTLRDRLFRLASYTVLVSVIANLTSTYMIYAYEQLPHTLVMLVTMVYFILTPLTALLYLYYTIVVLFYSFSLDKIDKRWHLLSLPYLIYLVLILLNPFLHNVFCVLPGQGYVRQALVGAPYYVMYFYCAASIFLAFSNRKRVERKTMWVLLLFPVLSFAFVGVQLLVPDVILTGTAAFSALFVMYLYLQNENLAADELTGLLNRKMLVQGLRNRIRASNQSFTMITVSLNNFKAVNDRFGTDAGDQLLCSVADFLSEQRRRHDVYRYGGDEFTLLLRSNHEADIQRELARLEARFAKTFKAEELECLLSASILVVSYPEAGEDVQTLLSAVDYTTMHARKQGGRGVYQYEPYMREAMVRKERIADLLGQALEKDGFEVHYQPIWSTEKERFTGAEALLRMKPTNIGNLYPDEFIPVAEETGRIVEITYLVLEKVCHMLQEMDEEHIPPLDSISINFSFIQFLQPDIKERFLEILAGHQVDPSRVKIEVTERILVEDIDTVSDFMRELHTKGVCFALDDFGVGYSNMETLLQLPLDVIKLDRSVMLATMGSQRRRKLIEHLIHGFSSAMEVDVIVEGVETAAQRDVVLSWDCHQIQGYFYARPMPGEQLKVFLLQAAENKALN